MLQSLGILVGTPATEHVCLKAEAALQVPLRTSASVALGGIDSQMPWYGAGDTFARDNTW